MGIGNPLGGDDALGLFVVGRINEKLQEEAGAERPKDIITLDAGTAPESYTSIIRKNKPAQLILVDASDMALPPGSVRRLSPENIATLSFATHGMPLSAFVSYVSELCGQVHIIGIQPERTEISDGLTDIVQKSVEHVVDLILNDRLGEIRALG
jgi:hydrogenase 3 maturation protease